MGIKNIYQLLNYIGIKKFEGIKGFKEAIQNNTYILTIDGNYMLYSSLNKDVLRSEDLICNFINSLKFHLEILSGNELKHVYLIFDGKRFPNKRKRIMKHPLMTYEGINQYILIIKDILKDEGIICHVMDEGDAENGCINRYVKDLSCDKIVVLSNDSDIIHIAYKKPVILLNKNFVKSFDIDTCDTWADEYSLKILLFMLGTDYTKRLFTDSMFIYCITKGDASLNNCAFAICTTNEDFLQAINDFIIKLAHFLYIAKYVLKKKFIISSNGLAMDNRAYLVIKNEILWHLKYSKCGVSDNDLIKTITEDNNNDCIYSCKSFISYCNKLYKL